MSPCRSAVVFSIALLAACGGEVDLAPADAGFGSDAAPIDATIAADGGVSPDARAPEPDAAVGGIDFDRDVMPILARHCDSACHRPNGGLVWFGGPNVRRELLNKTPSIRCVRETDRRELDRLVVPGDPEASILIRKAGLLDPSFSCGREMPADGRGGLRAIDPAAYETLLGWVAAGAAE